MADARRFLFNSNYETPALILNMSFSLVVGKGHYDKDVGFIQPGSADTTIAHNLPFVPLIIGQWSLNSNFEPCYDICNADIDIFRNGETGFYPRVSISISANNTNIEFSGLNAYTDRSVTIYVRLTGFVPPDYYGNIEPVQDTSDFQFSTDYNYPKLYLSGVVNFAQSSPKTQSVDHNLGYVPLARVWYRYTSNGLTYVEPSFYDTSYDGEDFYGAKIDSQKMTFGKHYGAGQYVYHIYGDEI